MSEQPPRGTLQCPNCRELFRCPMCVVNRPLIDRLEARVAELTAGLRLARDCMKKPFSVGGRSLWLDEVNCSVDQLLASMLLKGGE